MAATIRRLRLSCCHRARRRFVGPCFIGVFSFFAIFNNKALSGALQVIPAADNRANMFWGKGEHREMPRPFYCHR